jgi:hypothetical protein
VKETKTLGQVYCRKVAKNFGQPAFLSAREIEDDPPFDLDNRGEEIVK